MLSDIKKIMGFNNNEFDDVINNYIDSAKLDLRMCGISESIITSNDKLIHTAIISYVLGNLDIPNAEMYRDTYSLQKDYIRHISEYQESGE